MPVSGSPNTSTQPALTACRPAMMFSSVDFPQPLGPTIETKLPAATSRLTPSTAVCVPNRLTTSLRFSAARACAGGIERFASFLRRELVRIDTSHVDGLRAELRVGGRHKLRDHLGRTNRHQPVSREHLLQLANRENVRVRCRPQRVRDHVAHLLCIMVAYPLHRPRNGAHQPPGGVG